MLRVYNRRSFLAVLGALGGTVGSALAQDDVPVVAAASDLQFVVEEIAAAFTADTGMQVRLSFGSTGNFARQIREGAPFQIFMAADEQFIFDLVHDGFARNAGDLYAVGRIVVIAPPGSPLAADGTLKGLRQALTDGQITRFAIANPVHAPYGRRAKEALEHAGLWADMQPFLVLGENVSQAAQFVLSGNAEGGIIALSLALAPQLQQLGTFDLVPQDYHEPLRQRMALLKDAGPVAETFYAYMNQPAARDIMARYGFLIPKGE